MFHYTGSTKRGRFSTYQHTYVNGTEVRTLHNAAVTKITFKKPNGAEETLTFGGTDSLDNQLTRVSTGLYDWWINLDVPGDWSYNEEWSDTISGATVTVKNAVGVFHVGADLFSWSDQAAP